MLWIVDGKTYSPTQEELNRPFEEKQIRGKINMANRRYRTRVSMIADRFSYQPVNADIDHFVDQIIEIREERDRVVEVFEKELEEYLREGITNEHRVPNMGLETPV